MKSPNIPINPDLDFSSISDTLVYNISINESSFFDNTLQLSQISIQDDFLTKEQLKDESDRDQYISDLEMKLATALHMIKASYNDSLTEINPPPIDQLDTTKLNEILMQALLSDCTKSLHESQCSLDEFYRTLNHPDILLSTREQPIESSKSRQGSVETVLNSYYESPIPVVKNKITRRITSPMFDDSYTHPLEDLTESLLDHSTINMDHIDESRSRQLSRQQRIALESQESHALSQVETMKQLSTTPLYRDQKHTPMKTKRERVSNYSELNHELPPSKNVIDILGNMLPNSWFRQNKK